ncbi:YqcI/YcgG family protein [Salinarimonas sp. NSM]|uniref:YqcI/YcgG family protein n=1 Tax=Salinarimonas sp. NSM TaxID=3458003 RepID=UPI0040363FF3
MQLYSAEEATREFAPDDWRRHAFVDFAQRMTASDLPFPCIYGVSAFAADELRFVFCEEMTADALTDALGAFVPRARSFGRHTSLVAFSRPCESLGVAQYRQRFWSLLAGIAARDRAPWPAGVPRELDDPDWEFCFAGEPLFVVCNTPDHRARRSRYSPALTLTFQPRWVFDGILGTDDQARRAFAAVRARLQRYDDTPVAAVLGRYGDPGNREFAQYFLDDGAGDDRRCPFHTLPIEESVT